MRHSRSALLVAAAITALVIATSANAQTVPGTTSGQTPPDPTSAQTGELAPGQAPSPAAQPAGPEVGEDVIVTAQKRAQTLIDVPQSVSVISGGALERQQAVTFEDYQKLVPGLNLQESSPGEARLVLRGINTGGVASTVATYVDETPFGSSSGQVNGAILAGEFDTFDIARIEVLRGPQGTLYGASSLGGVVKFVTALPETDHVEARARGEVESTEGGDISYQGSALLNVPLSSDLAVRASGFYRNYGGFIDSIGTAGSRVDNNINRDQSYGGRASLLFKPTDKLSIRLSALVQNLDDRAPTLAEADNFTLIPLYGRLSQSEYVPQSRNIDYRLYNGTLNWDFGFASLLSSTSYATQNEAIEEDETVPYGTALGLFSAAGPALDVGLRQHTNLDKFTQEVRLQSATSTVFEWLVGGYYTHEKGAILQRLDALTPGTLTVSAAVPQLADIFTDSTYQEVAGFANATIHFGPKFDLEFGGRESHNYQTSSQGGTGLLAPAALGAKSSEDVFTWSVAPKFKLDDHASIYARVAKGFRPGGPNILPPNATGVPSTYRSDSLISYEAGIKAETSDHSLSVDVAGFHIDWNDIQLFAEVNNFGVNANGGKAVSDGAEATFTLRPTRGLDLSINGAYTNAHLTQATDPLIGGRAGDKLPYVPKVSAAANGDYDWALGGHTAFIGGSLRMVSKQSADFDPAFLASYGRQRAIPSYVVGDAHIGYDLGKFSVEVYAKNIGNERGITSVVTGGGLPPAPNGAVNVGLIRPRVVGLSLTAGL